LEAGIVDDPDREVRVIEDQGAAEPAAHVLYFLIPPRPALGASLTEEQLRVAAESLSASQMNCPPAPTPMSTCCCDITAAPSVVD
jgi:hypothetical protein